MLALFNAFTAGAVDAAAIASTAAMAVLDGVAPQGAAAWRGLAPPLCAAWLDDVAAVATAPRAVWNLLAALAHTRGGDVPVVAAFAFGRGAGGGAVSVRYTREAGGRAVHVEVEGMAAHRLHVGVVSGTRGGAVAYWRTVCPYPSADCDAATFDAAVAAAQAEVARMELRCACPASDAAVNAAILWRRGTPCACAGGLGAAATRHAVLVDACPLTRARGGLAREWWGWHADAPPPRAPLATAAAAAAATFVRGLTWHACAARGSWRDVPALPHVAAAVGDDRASSTCAWCGVTVAHEAAPLTVEDAWAAFQRAVARGGAL